MFKPKKLLLLSLSLSLLVFPPFLFAEESFTITTYYPSPYGSYRELRAQRIAIGDNYIKGDEYCWEGSCTNTISTDADLVVQGNVGIGTTAPNTALDVNGAFSMRNMVAPAVSPVGQGRIYFDSIANKFKVSENTGSYVNLGGYITYFRDNGCWPNDTIIGYRRMATTCDGRCSPSCGTFCTTLEDNGWYSSSLPSPYTCSYKVGVCAFGCLPAIQTCSSTLWYLCRANF